MSLGPDEERRDFELGLEALDRCGVRPVGHRAALWDASWLTPELVAEHGLLYDSSLMDDDRPYVLSCRAGDIVELPPHWALDDWEQYAFLPDPPIGTVIETPAKATALWWAELQAARRHGGLCVLTAHPFLSGRASRVEALRHLCEAALMAGDIAFATCRQVAERVQADPNVHRRPLAPVEVDETIYPP